MADTFGPNRIHPHPFLRWTGPPPPARHPAFVGLRSSIREDERSVTSDRQLGHRISTIGAFHRATTRASFRALMACPKTRVLFFSLAIAGAFTAVPRPAQATGSLQFGVPEGETVFGSTGYSGVLRGGYVAPMNDQLSLGGEFILDIGTFGSVRAAGNAITLGGAFRIDLLLADTEDLLVGLTLSPGIGVGFPQVGDAGFALLLHPDLNIGYKASRQVIVGGGITIPVTVYIGNGGAAVVVPILFGPVAEFMLTPQLSVLTQLKLGPVLAGGGAGSFGGFGADFGLDLRAGVTYRF